MNADLLMAENAVGLVWIDFRLFQPSNELWQDLLVFVVLPSFDGRGIFSHLRQVKLAFSPNSGSKEEDRPRKVERKVRRCNSDSAMIINGPYPKRGG